MEARVSALVDQPKVPEPRFNSGAPVLDAGFECFDPVIQVPYSTPVMLLPLLSTQLPPLPTSPFPPLSYLTSQPSPPRAQREARTTWLGSGPLRRPLRFARTESRRNRGLTPLDWAMRTFAIIEERRLDIEKRRLELNKARDKHFHERQMEILRIMQSLVAKCHRILDSSTDKPFR